MMNEVNQPPATPQPTPAGEGVRLSRSGAVFLPFSTNIRQELDDIDSRLDGSVYTSFIRSYIDDLRAQLVSMTARAEASESRERRLRITLDAVRDMARDGQGEWAAVDPVYAPEWTQPFSNIEDFVTKSLDITPPALAAHKGEGETKQQL